MPVSRYLQAQPNLTLELKIRKDPIVRRKAREILNDPRDFDRIAAAVSPDNLHALKSLTVQSGHTHKVNNPLSEYSGSRSTLTSSRGDNLNGSQHSIPYGSAVLEASCLDYTTDNCFAGYATIRRLGNTSAKKSNDNLSKISSSGSTKSMPTDVHLIGAKSENSLDNEQTHSAVKKQDKKPRFHYDKDILVQESSRNRPRSRASATSSNRNSAIETTDQKEFSETSNSPDKESRSLSPEIKEAIATADPSSCWADYFPENLSLNSSFATQKPETEEQSETEPPLITEFQVSSPKKANDESSDSHVLLNVSSDANYSYVTTSPESLNETGPSTSPMHKNLNESFTDDENSPAQQTQHFNSPVLGQTPRNLFFSSEPSSNSAATAVSGGNLLSGRLTNVTPINGISGSVNHENYEVIGVRSAKGSSNRRDSFEKKNLDLEDDDEDPEEKCYILESLEIAAPPPPKPTPEVDLAAAKRLASRLYYLNGFGKSDVPKHLGKKQEFSQVVATEYFKFFDFHQERIDVSLRKFFSNLGLYGDTQERERILSHFSRRYADCNPDLFPSFECVDYLVTALILLNQDLNALRAGSHNTLGVKPMTASQFVTNVITKPQHMEGQPAEEYTEYSRQLLTELYDSIRDEPLMCAGFPSMPGMDPMGGMTIDYYQMPEYYTDGVDGHSQQKGNYMTVEAPENNVNSLSYPSAIFNPTAGGAIGVAGILAPISFSGYLSRKWLFEPELKKTSRMKRSWKHWYVSLHGFDLMHHKSRDDAVNKSGIEQKALVLSLHHAFASPVHPLSSTSHIDPPSVTSMTSSSENVDEAGSVLGGEDTSSFSESVNSRSLYGAAGVLRASSKKEKERVGSWDFTVRLADWAEYQYRCRSKQEMEEWVCTINLIAAFSAPPLMPPISNSAASNSSKGASQSSSTLSFHKHFKPTSFTNLSLQDQISMWGSWINSSEMCHADAMKRHADTLPPNNASKQVVQAALHEVQYHAFELQRYQTYQEALIESVNNSQSSAYLNQTNNQLNVAAVSQSNGQGNFHLQNRNLNQMKLDENPSANNQAAGIYSPNEVININMGPNKGRVLGSKKPNLNSKSVDYGVL
ncbi:uncharacterized protein LOC134843682 isoform X2 [Symsagittifera roscoffensis]|uniref:uncharacterized protein LOC134843682 isoform X2 n=1 Tax=Symsagittifera roscoffensis TaxID=84072 RepID=UPI00307C3AF1